LNRSILQLFILLQFIEDDRRNPDGTYERNINLPTQMCLGPSYTLGRSTAQQAGVVQMFDRILTELSLKLKRLDIDQSEIACIKGIILLNSGEFQGSLSI
jgi:hypothetical protein